jgi:transposase-like protein
MPSRWKHDRPLSRAQFEARFPDDAACAEYLARRRWPDGFVCPACGGAKGWALKGKRFTWECAACGKQTSVTAGTVMHRSHLPLKTWFLAAHIVTSHSNGMSALQLQAQLGLGSYKTAWLLLHKLRRAMVDPDRSLLEDLVEVDETDIPLRRKDDPPAGGRGRSAVGKMLVAGAVELSPEGQPRRIRLAPLADFSAATLKPFVAAVAAPGATVITDGWSGYARLPGHVHDAKVVGRMAAHVVLKWTHRVFSNLKRWGLGVFHGLRRPHLQRYLDEFVFRWNRRRHTAAAFDTLLGIGTRLGHASYRDFVKQRA